MKDLYDQMIEEQIELTSLTKTDDPLWDEPSQSLIGYCFYSLEALSYQMSNAVQATIFSFTGNTIGNLNLDIIPLNEQEEVFKEVPEDPYELIGQFMNFKVCINSFDNIQANNYDNLFVEYTGFNDRKLYRSEIV